jgi:CHASE3 domain sensor protein
VSDTSVADYFSSAIDVPVNDLPARTEQTRPALIQESVPERPPLSPASERFWPLGAGAKILLALFLAALAAGAIFSYQALEGLRTRSDWVTHTLLVRGTSERLISRLQDAESAELQYLFSGDTTFRRAVESELTSSRQSVAHLEQLTLDNPAQQGRVHALALAVDTRFADLERTMDSYSRGDRDAANASIAAIYNKHPMDDIRSRLRDIEAVEQSLLSVRTRRAGDAFDLVVAVGAATLSSLILLLALFLWSARRDFLTRSRLEYAVSESETRQAFLLRLNDRLRSINDSEQMQFAAASVLGEHLRASRVGYAEDQADAEHLAVRHNYTDGVQGIEGSYRYADFDAGLLAKFREGRTVVSPDLSQDRTMTDAERAAYARLGVGSMVNVPLMRSGQLRAVLFVHDMRARLEC